MSDTELAAASAVPPKAAPDRNQAGHGWFREALRAPEWGLLAGLLAVVGAVYLIDSTHTFFSRASFINLVHDSALYGVLALGAATVIIAGGIDLSVGAVVALTGVVCAKVLADWGPLLAQKVTSALPFLPWVPLSSTGGSVFLVTLSVVAGLALGLLVGLFHALLINQFRLPPFIATLATMAGLRSVAIVLSENRTIRVAVPMFRVFGNDDRFAVPIFLISALAMSILMGGTVLGRHLFALGGNEAAARLSGLRTMRLKTVAYCLSGLFAAIGGIVFLGNASKADAVNMGKSYELYAITAAVVGGCSLAGGVGSIRGTVLGLILIQVVIKGTGLAVRSIDPSMIEGLVLGTVVVLAVGFNQRFRVRG